MIECVGIENCLNFFPYNPLGEQFKLRHKICVEELGWTDGITSHDGFEADNYDKPGTRYLVKRSDRDGRILGVTRLFPTVDQLTPDDAKGHFMISDNFSELVSGEVPSGKDIYEASRMVVCPTLRSDKDARRKVVNELVVGYMEYAIMKKIESYVALMNPHYWKVFERPGWEVEYLGPETDIGGEIVRVGRLWISGEVNRAVRKSTEIYQPVLDFGIEPVVRQENIYESVFRRQSSTPVIQSSGIYASGAA